MRNADRTSEDILPGIAGTTRSKLAVVMLRLRESQWLLAFLGALIGTIIGYLIVRYSGTISEMIPGNTWSSTASEARATLLAFIGVEITALSIVMSLTMITVQNAANQFSHRLLRYYLRDLVQQSVFGVIAGSTAYFVTVAALLGFDETVERVSRPSLGLAVLFLVASGIALVVQVNHTLQIIRLEVVLLRVVEVTKEAFVNAMAMFDGISFQFNRPLLMSDSAVVVSARDSGYVSYAGIKPLLQIAENHNYKIRVDTEIGDHAVRGAPIGWIESETSDADVPEAVLGQISESMGINGWRNPKVDTGLGIRVLVDIAIKALSPSINDPYTAVKSIDHLARVLAFLAGQQLGDITLSDRQGHPRLQLRSPTFKDYLLLSTDQITRYGSKEPSVIQRLIKMICDIGLVLKSTADKAEALYVMRNIMTEAEKSINDPEWLAALRKQAKETEETIISGPTPGFTPPDGL